ncbi:AAA family ATPase [Propionibacterium sp.]|uniref:MinD/ParA family ATP-binding protein n=1 Tax=Propionibacterium sp. TaxID=1977903 RepID=UPI0039EBFB31
MSETRQGPAGTDLNSMGVLGSTEIVQLALIDRQANLTMTMNGHRSEMAAAGIDAAVRMAIQEASAAARRDATQYHLLVVSPLGQKHYRIDGSDHDMELAPVPEEDQPRRVRALTNTGDTDEDDTDEEATPPTSARRSFLVEEDVELPAVWGWRGTMNRHLGMHLAPGADERSEREDILTVSQHWNGPRTIAIVNGKGGAGKTPTTVLLSAVFARFGGSGVLAWDNNQTRGTLGWRTEQGDHDATLLDLLPEIGGLLSREAQSADLEHFVHHQVRDRFDVLRSKPMALAQEQRVGPMDVDAIHTVATKYYRMVFIDSGNDESDPMWRRMIDLADEIVVVTSTRDDHAEAGALLLEALAGRDAHSAGLAKDAVTIVTQADSRATSHDIRRVVDGFDELSREVVTIPFDQAMVGGVLRYDALDPRTKRAWLAAGAAVARGL